MTVTKINRKISVTARNALFAVATAGSSISCEQLTTFEFWNQFNIKAFGADPSETPENNAQYIQNAIDSGINPIIFGYEGEVYTISKPLILKSNKEYKINAEIKIQDGLESLLTANTNLNDVDFLVANPEYFEIGQTVTVTDNSKTVVYATYRGHCGTVTGIAGNKITIDNPAGDTYLMAQNARLSHCQGCFLASNKHNIVISGSGTINGNRYNQPQTHPVHNNPQSEYQAAAITLCFYVCQNVYVKDISIENGLMHNLSFSGPNGLTLNNNILVENVTLTYGHDKNILVRFTDNSTFRNIIAKYATWEDGLIFYANNNYALVENCLFEGNGRSGFYWNASTSLYLTATNITTKDNTRGLYLTGRNALISNVQMNDALVLNAVYDCKDIVLNNINISYSTGISGYIFYMYGGIDNIQVNNLYIDHCTGTAFKSVSYLGLVPQHIVINTGALTNHTGVKEDYALGTDITFINFSGL